jgi:hypothetical protein
MISHNCLVTAKGVRPDAVIIDAGLVEHAVRTVYHLQRADDVSAQVFRQHLLFDLA